MDHRCIKISINLRALAFCVRDTDSPEYTRILPQTIYAYPKKIVQKTSDRNCAQGLRKHNIKAIGRIQRFEPIRLQMGEKVVTRVGR